MTYKTRQRDAIRRVVEDSDRPLTAPEICERAGSEIAQLGIATVYRTIKVLVEAGEMRPVEVPGAAPHYESAARKHHHFFLCRECRRLFALVGCLHGVDDLAPKGYRVSGHEIVLYGECAECQGVAV